MDINILHVYTCSTYPDMGLFIAAVNCCYFYSLIFNLYVLYFMLPYNMFGFGYNIFGFWYNMLGFCLVVGGSMAPVRI